MEWWLRRSVVRVRGGLQEEVIVNARPGSRKCSTCYGAGSWRVSWGQTFRANDVPPPSLVGRWSPASTHLYSGP